MTFPLDFSGNVSCGSIFNPNPELFRLNFMQDVRERLERAHARVEMKGTELFFRTSAVSMLSVDGSLLANVPSGKLTLNEEKGTVTYYLDFRRSFKIYSALVLGIFGSFFILVVNGPLLWRILIIISAWAAMVVVSALAGVSGFRQFLTKILREMNHRTYEANAHQQAPAWDSVERESYLEVKRKLKGMLAAETQRWIASL